MTPSTATDVSVTDRPDREQFEAEIDGSRVGLAAYRLEGDTITFTHTEVDDAAEGKGVGSALAKAALDSARERALRVVPECPFIARWIKRHDAYLDLVPEEHRHHVREA